ncbi:hypothetical protein AHiyo6_00420 [Arthrobacter sp. Hiyo6]|nr:hypothetical protein AHiyo6_00420 [Arthrobacter sp. Hiyo6]
MTASPEKQPKPFEGDGEPTPEELAIVLEAMATTLAKPIETDSVEAIAAIAFPNDREAKRQYGQRIEALIAAAFDKGVQWGGDIVIAAQKGGDRQIEVIEAAARIDELERLDGLAYGQDFFNYQQGRLKALRAEPTTI